MKKLFLILMLGVLGVFISSCDSEDDPITPEETGKIFVTSTPLGAQIWVHGNNTGKVTPDTVSNLSVGNHEVTLKLSEYSDTTFTVAVTENQTTSRNITLTSALSLTNIHL